MLTKRYVYSNKSLPALFDKIREGTAPAKFTIQHLKDLGFKSSNDRAIIGLLKDLGFLSDDGQPTPLYHEYRDASKSRAVLGQALANAYADLFTISERPTESDRPLIHGKFMSSHNVKESLADFQTATFFALLKLADVGRATAQPPQNDSAETGAAAQIDAGAPVVNPPAPRHRPELHYSIEIHLPATKDIQVFNAIFKSLKEHLVD